MSDTIQSYNRAFMPYAFDTVIAAMFLPFGGIKSIRSQALEIADIKPGARVLELGCGTGAITELLEKRGAVVTAIDGSETMLNRARKRSLNANFLKQNLAWLSLEGQFDVILFAFVLHELPYELRLKVFAQIYPLLAPGGKVLIVDHAVPEEKGFSRLWRSLLMKLEPPTVADCISNGYDQELQANKFELVEKRNLAKGTVALTISVPKQTS
ncbi:MAG: methyltransferase domain-containing protein [Bdellovibrionaceae bacterium]|nr:methyltransferase domain-containing protein [Pseudobdellovibrionaceae bacterium]